MAAGDATTAENMVDPPRSVDVPLELLPPIDEHYVDVDAPADTTWAALFPTLQRSFDGRFARRYAKHVEASETSARGDLHHPGGTLPGFCVTRSIAPVMLALAGSHRFAKYAVVFRIDLLPGQRSCVKIETRAEFIGRRGRLYRAAVIGTRIHVIAVNRMLRAIKRRAERSVAGS
jgi:hypothetical protein